jgi:uncharacterized membrane protein YqhA
MFVDVHHILFKKALLQTGIHIDLMLSTLLLAYKDKIVHTCESSKTH